jgi:hypothetical protein
MKLKLTVLLAGALTLVALSLLFIAPPAAAQTIPTETPGTAGVAVSEPVTLTVTGAITNGTAGAANPAGGLTVNVHTFDPNDNLGNVTTLSTTLSANGTFVVEAVPSQAGWQVAVSTEYEDVLYSSKLVTVAAGQTAIDLPVVVYETTTETAAVNVEQMHMFFDFGSGTVSVLELFIVSNAGDRAVVNPSGTIEFLVPAGATDLQVQGEVEGVDYVRTAEGFAETRPIAPGSGTGQILLSFSLPYPGQMSFEQKMLYPVAAAGVLVPETGVKLTSSLLQDEGLQNMQNNAYRIYGIKDMKAGASLAFQLSGEPGSAAPAPVAAAAAAGSPQGGLDAQSLGIGVGVLGLVVVVIGVWFYRRQARPAGAAAPAGGLNQDELMQAIADLDDAFESGEVEAPVYERRRARLKAQLVELMAGEK